MGCPSAGIPIARGPISHSLRCRRNVSQCFVPTNIIPYPHYPLLRAMNVHRMCLSGRLAEQRTGLPSTHRSLLFNLSALVHFIYVSVAAEAKECKWERIVCTVHERFTATCGRCRLRLSGLEFKPYLEGKYSSLPSALSSPFRTLVYNREFWRCDSKSGRRNKRCFDGLAAKQLTNATPETLCQTCRLLVRNDQWRRFSSVFEDDELSWLQW